ncbi:MAG: hypothetical protein IRZ08_20225 [Frankia sp.]|nr:hypothetical protein [Frankia sp.]
MSTVVLLAVSAFLLAVPAGLYAAAVRRPNRSAARRGADSGHALPPPYPDLLSPEPGALGLGAGSPVRPAGRHGGLGPAGHRWPALAMATGTHVDQLAYRLHWVARDYLRQTLPQPNRPARVDEDALRVSEALETAIELMLRPEHERRPGELAAAVREVERRWRAVRRERRRQDRLWLDLRWDGAGPDLPELDDDVDAWGPRHETAAWADEGTGHPRGAPLVAPPGREPGGKHVPDRREAAMTTD